MKTCSPASCTDLHLMTGRRTAWRYRQDQPNNQPWSDGRESGRSFLASNEWACRRVSVIKSKTNSYHELFIRYFFITWYFAWTFFRALKPSCTSTLGAALRTAVEVERWRTAGANRLTFCKHESYINKMKSTEALSNRGKIVRCIPLACQILMLSSPFLNFDQAHTHKQPHSGRENTILEFV